MEGIGNGLLSVANENIGNGQQSVTNTWSLMLIFLLVKFQNLIHILQVHLHVSIFLCSNKNQFDDMQKIILFRS